MMKTLRDIGHLEGVNVLVRVDFNVPVAHGKVADDFRIRSAMPTIAFLAERGARIILISHMEGNTGENPSLEPVAEHLNQLGVHASFIKDLKKARPFIASDLQNGQCLLLENLRIYEGEKKNDPKFAKELASLADIYVNDAFSVSHRAHASIVGVPAHMPAYAGLQMEQEIAHLSQAFTPRHPFVFILGGAKFETKLPLLQKFMGIADTVFVGGALANDFFKKKGYEIGTSLVSEGNIDLAGFLADPKLMIPSDVTVDGHAIKAADAVASTEKIFDAGPQTLEQLRQKLNEASFILWNGPLGLYEAGYREITLELARMIGEISSRTGAVSIVGGGDTLAAISTLGIQDAFSFISTGGGAMLDFLAQGTLPGIEALENSR